MCIRTEYIDCHFPNICFEGSAVDDLKSKGVRFGPILLISVRFGSYASERQARANERPVSHRSEGDDCVRVEKGVAMWPSLDVNTSCKRFDLIDLIDNHR